MGIYLNPGNEGFRKIVRREIYVDKTEMIRVINAFIDTSNSYICVSRPRRFGKTFAGNMLCAYYSKGCDSRELFGRFKISKDPHFAEKLNRFNVIKIDMNSEYQNAECEKTLLKNLTEEIKEEFAAAFPNVQFRESDNLARCILRVYAATGETFIVLIDEYDVLVREQVSQSLFDEYLSFLNGLFKSDTLRPAIALAYLTGILPIVRDKVQSKLNNFEEYTVLDPGELAEYAGFTDEEVRRLCAERGIDYEECRRWYDGYHLEGLDIYNPESVVKAVQKKIFGGYWGQTSSYEAISDRIRQNFAGTKDAVIRMLAGESVPVNVRSFLNSMTGFSTKDDVFGYLIHVGYLAYDREAQTCRIPNKEVREEWALALNKVPEEYALTTRIIEDSRDLLESTWAGDEAAVARALDAAHIHVTSNRSYNNEDALQSAICLAYIYALNHYTVVREMTAGKGFADVVFIPVKCSRPAMVVELKHNKCAESAIFQIRERRYFQPLTHYRGNLLFVGISYDEKEKTHECRIERFVV